MTNYTNNHGILCVTIEDVDYISSKGDTISLPEDNAQVKTWVARNFISVVTTDKVKTSQTDKKQDNG